MDFFGLKSFQIFFNDNLRKKNEMWKEFFLQENYRLGIMWKTMLKCG